MKRTLAVFAAIALLFALSACTASGVYDDGEKIKSSVGTSLKIGCVTNRTATEMTMTAQSYDGVIQIAAKKFTKDNPALDLTMSISDGRLKIVALGEDGVLTTLAETATAEDSVTAPLKTILGAGTYRILLVGDAASNVSLHFIFTETYPMI